MSSSNVVRKAAHESATVDRVHYVAIVLIRECSRQNP